MSTSFTKKERVIRARVLEDQALGEAFDHDRSLSIAGPHIPFDWKVKAGRSGSLLESFYHAFNGLRTGFQTERNLKVHFSLAIAAVILGLILKIDSISWMAICMAIGVVLTAEFINTALEHVVDLVTEKTYHPAAKQAKDTAAAAVLIAALSSLAVGCVVFLPRLSALIR